MSTDYVYNYEKLEIYQRSKQLIAELYKMTGKLPSIEKYNLADQTRRSVTSVCLNIAEGNSKYYKKEQARYADNALASLMEVNACLDIAVELDYVKIKDLEEARALIKEIYFKLIAYKKSKFK
ncbi:MAG: four helix bundle protein [Patescibacteria group bacterium]|nr:four helix bundle protein [Patescibacteria group bacterium]